MGVGVGSGLLLGILVPLFVTDCEKSGDPGDCGAMRGIMIAIGAGSGMLLGGGIGAAIGAAIPKKPKVSVAPVINHSKAFGNSYGAGIQGTF